MTSAAKRLFRIAGAGFAITWAVAATIVPALADGGAGGFGIRPDFTNGGVGAPGGSGITGNSGGNALGCGGGGGGAAGGGAGGTGGGGTCTPGATGGASGTAGAPNGGNGGGGIAGGGGGGGGGAHGTNSATITNTTPLAGGNGGNGGQGSVSAGGGGGGAGGYGAVLTGAGASSNTNSITAGNGGNGGNGDGSPPNAAGSGGGGGVGILFTTSGATFTNSGSVTGGNGGTPGIGPTQGGYAAGGAGIVGAGLTIINSGTISGGMASYNSARANGITFTGGNNTLSFTNATTGITGNIDVTGQLTFAQTTGSVTVDNTITGSGNVIINNTSGGVTFNTANFYAGTTTITAGLLTISATGSITSNVTNSGGFVNFGTVTGSVTNNGGASNSGTITSGVTNNNSFNNLTGGTIDGGLTNNGGGSFTQQAGATLNGGVTNSGAMTVGGIVNGTINNSGAFSTASDTTNDGSAFNNSGTIGSLNINGGNFTGVGTLTNTSTAAMGVRVFAGRTLSATSIVNGAGATFDNSGIVNGDVTSNAGLINNNAGATWTGNVTNGTGTVTNGGTWTGSVTNAGGINNNAGATWTGNVAANSGTIANAGGATWVGNLTNDAGTVTNGGTWTGSVDNANVFANSGTVSGGLTNSGTYTQTAGATSGGVTNTGTVNAQGGKFEGIVNNNGSGVINVTGAVTGDGSAFNNIGAALLNVSSGDFTGLGAITNSSTANTGINVSQGRTLGATSITNAAGATFVNNGTVSSTLTVNGGTVRGNGTFIGNSTFSGGTLSPGNSIGTLTFQGNLTLTTAATYLIEVDPNGSDRVNVTGTATLGGATVSAQFTNGSYVTRRYTILNATGGVSGTFNTLVNTNLPTNFTSQLSYDANNAYLNLTLNFTPTSTDSNTTTTNNDNNSTTTDNSAPPPNPTPRFGNRLTGNQSSVATALIRSFNSAGGIPLAFGVLTPLGLTQVAGESATGTQQTTFDAMGQFGAMLTDPSLGQRGPNAPQTGATGYADEASAHASTRKRRNGMEQDAYAAMARKAPPRAAFEQRWSVWGAGYGGTQSTSGNVAAGTADTSSRISGGAAGFDYRLTPDTLVGFALGGAGSRYNLANGLGSGSSEMFQAGVYGRHIIGAAYLAGALAYGWQDVTTDRNVFLNSYRARFDANALTGRLETGYRFAFGSSGLTPYAAGQFTTFWLPNYAEQVVAGTNLFALAYQSNDVTASRSELGLRGDASFAMQDATLTLRGRAAWAHNFNTDRSVSTYFQTLPVSGFVVNGASPAHDAALVSAGAEARWLNGFSIAATFEGEFSRITESYAGKGTVRYQW
jgi:uncharacterized protein with beta-barrel porin domain